jgi:hypothetical protein
MSADPATEPEEAPSSGSLWPPLIGAILVLAALTFLLRREPGNLPVPLPTSPSEAPDLAEFHPQAVPGDGFIGSDSCRECHAHEHETWHASYHRTMTQLAHPETVMGDFNNVALSFPGTNGFKQFQLHSNADGLWAEFDTFGDLTFGDDRITLPVVMTTGSHHMQAYWMSLGNRRTMGLLPIVYLREDERWVPRRAAFLMPPSDVFSMEIGRWDKGCIRCHTTGSRPHEFVTNGLATFDSSVSEFGISCEACHGRAEEHVRLRRQAEIDGEPPVDDPIVNPAALSHRLSSQVCGACHSLFKYPKGHHIHQPGEPIDTNRVHLVGSDLARPDAITAGHKGRADEQTGSAAHENLNGYFWPDGQLRVVGREYSALRHSDCHQSGNMSCLSCHRLHQSKTDSRSAKEWANDLMAAGMYSDHACLQCHETEKFATVFHTRHGADSAGSRCYNCHMPHTAYGLLKAVRTHTISSPDIATEIRTGRPNACNLCHIDRTLEWSADHLKEWYGISKPKLKPPSRETAAAIVWALRGDANLRALAAWHLGWQPAHSAIISPEWIPPILSILMDDPYDAVRYIAYRSLKSLPGYGDTEFDYVASEAKRRQIIETIGLDWNNRRSPGLVNRPELLVNPAGRIDFPALRDHMNSRNHRLVHLLE